MTTTTDGIRTEATRFFLSELSTTLARWQPQDFSSCKDGTQLNQLVIELDCARRQFDSKLFFVVIFGPLKAGKSTLTNTLAGETVSPAGFGRETTRRPSLIIQDQVSRIDQYFSTDGEINELLSQLENTTAAPVSDREKVADVRVQKAQNAFNRVADFIRGVSGPEDLKGIVDIQSHPLTEENLNRMLVEVEGSTRVPLLTVIHCKGGPFLTPGVAIVDMPGLDGSRSNWRENPIHEWVVERAEFFFFVQSSVATFNRETVTFLKDIVGQAKKPPVWAIQNIFDAQHWQPIEVRRQAEANQRDEGAKRLEALLKQTTRGVVPLNLGLAWDGKQSPGEPWLAASKFPEFEKELSQVLQSERASIQECVCLEKMEQSFDSGQQELAQITQHLAKIRSQHHRIREQLNAAQNQVNGIDYVDRWKDSVAGAIESKIGEPGKIVWRAQMNTAIESFQQRHDRKVTGKAINQAICTMTAKLVAAGLDRHFSKSYLLPQYLQLANQFCEPAEANALSAIQKLLAELNLAPLPNAQEPYLQDIPDSPAILFVDPAPLAETKAWFWDKQHEGGTIKEHLENLRKGWTAEFEEKIPGWVNQFVQDHFSGYCEKRRQKFRAHLDGLVQEFEASVAAEERAILATETILQQLTADLSNLRVPLANALSGQSAGARRS